MPDPRCAYDAFICYAGPDKPRAAALRAALVDTGLRVFFDETSMRGGDDIDRSLLAAIKASCSVVALLSPAWAAGRYNRQELRYAGKLFEQGGPPFRLIPVELDPAWESVEIQTPSPIIAHGIEGARWIERVVDAVRGARDADTDAAPDLESAVQQAFQELEEARALGDEGVAAQAETAWIEARRLARDGRPLTAGDRLGSGRFKLTKLLGMGGFSEVWQASDTVNRATQVAIKVLHGHLSRDESRLQRFRRGARRLQDVKHDNIVRVRQDVQKDGHRYYFVMDLIDGRSLANWIESGQLAYEKVPGLIRKAGAALTCAHEAGLIHRDVHPGNILVGHDNETVTLIDFDLVRAPGTTGGTRTGLGFPYFAPPDAPEDVDERSDVFGLAMTAIACWLGRLPKLGDIREFGSVISSLKCSDAQRSALEKATSTKQHKRFSSIGEFCEALQLPPPGMVSRRLRHVPYDRRQGRADPFGALGGELPGAISVHVSDPWDGDDLLNAMRSMPAADIELARARNVLLEWVTPDLGVEALAYVWYALESIGLPPERGAFFARSGRPMPSEDLGGWVPIAGGGFRMGDGRSSASDRQPVHPVTLSAFEMRATLITNLEYSLFDPEHQKRKKARPEPLPEYSRHPVRTVSWWEAYIFSRWANASLPTEAEWEYACRAGSDELYCFGSDEALLEQYAWYTLNSGHVTHEVAELAPNAYGIYDMHGMLYEWCQDWYGPYGGAHQVNPSGPPDGTQRVIRGSTFRSRAETCWSCRREKNLPDHRGRRGIRLVRRPTGITLSRLVRSETVAGPVQLALPPWIPAEVRPLEVPLPDESALQSVGTRVKPAPRSVPPEPARSRRRRSVARKTVHTTGTPKPRQQVFDTYWSFAAERQSVFYRRLAGQPGPWTHDPILQDFKFCNTFRASDRVSQFLIRHVIYGDGLSQDAEDVVFRTLLFRLFNKIESWPVFMGVKGVGGEPRAKNFVAARYSKALDAEMEQGNRIFGNAYMIAPPGNAFGGDHARKHDGYLALLAHMLRDGFVQKVQRARHFSDVYQLLLSYPLIGKFIAYQLATDLNYGPVIDFDENDFTKAGPGAERGIDKCFESRGGMSSADIIQWMVKHQDAELERVCARLGYDPRVARLWDLRLKAIDCQNLFCETDKYSRVAFPELKSNRKRIKSKFSATPRKIGYFYPPKWGINDRVHTPPVDLPPLGPAPEDD